MPPRAGGRRRAGGRDRNAGPAQLPWRDVRSPFPPLGVLSGDELEHVHEASLTVLEDLGMEVLGEHARRLYRKGRRRCRRQRHAGALRPWSHRRAGSQGAAGVHASRPRSRALRHAGRQQDRHLRSLQPALLLRSRRRTPRRQFRGFPQPRAGRGKPQLRPLLRRLSGRTDRSAGPHAASGLLHDVHHPDRPRLAHLCPGCGTQSRRHRHEPDRARHRRGRDGGTPRPAHDDQHQLAATSRRADEPGADRNGAGRPGPWP